MPDNLCASCGCRAVTAAPGTRLCSACQTRLRANLAVLPDLHAACADELTPSDHRTRERVTGWTPKGIVLREGVMTVRSDMVAVLASWATLIVDDRRVRGPRGQEVRHLVAFLLHHLGWLAAHPAAGDFADEIGELVRAVRDVLDPGKAADLAVSSCERPGCAEPVLARIGARDPGRHLVACTAGHRVPPEHWLRLGTHAGRGKAAKADRKPATPDRRALARDTAVATRARS